MIALRRPFRWHSAAIARAAALVAVAAFPPVTLAAAADESSGPPIRWVGRFADGASPWREVEVASGLKRNSFRLREWDGVSAVEVDSSRSMSLFARPLAIDLDATPILCWRWRVDAPLAGADMTRRDGDDFAARVYVSLAIPDSQKSLALRARLAVARAIWGPELPDAAVNYVWDNRHPVGTRRPNAYTDRAMMIVLRSGAADAGHWVEERRHVRRDVADLFGVTARAVQLAVTADTDNTGESAHAGFADFHFVAQDAPCAKAR